MERPAGSVDQALETRDNFAPIPLGDISVKGGSPPVWEKELVNGHRSRRCGYDVDIYVIGMDGKPSERVTWRHKDVYDLERTMELAKAIMTVGGMNLKEIWIGDDRLVQSMRDHARNNGLPARIHRDTPMHDNHFHIRLWNKDNDPRCGF